MSRTIFVFCIGLLLPIMVTAQVAVVRPPIDPVIDEDIIPRPNPLSSTLMIKYGAKAGLNLSTMANEMSFDPLFGLGTGVRVGAFINIRWGQRTENSLPGTGYWGFQPEIVYSMQNVDSKHSLIRLNYFMLPLMLKYYSTTSLSFEAGPEISYLFEAAPESFAYDGAEVPVGDISGLGVGLSAGVSYDTEIGFTTGLRYTHGLVDLAKNLRWKNHNIQVTVGWMF